MKHPILLIVGLGNPGSEYEQTRHNAGTWLIDAIAHAHGETLRNETKFSGFCASIQIDSNTCRLLKPTTYMNHSGQSVIKLATFYKIPPESILVAHDELDLPVGTIKLKQGGGHAGHNGLRDIIGHLGTRDFQRARIGIGHPGDSKKVHDYVLGRPSKSDESAIMDTITSLNALLPDVVDGDFQKVMKELHTG